MLHVFFKQRIQREVNLEGKRKMEGPYQARDSFICAFIHSTNIISVLGKQNLYSRKRSQGTQ